MSPRTLRRKGLSLARLYRRRPDLKIARRPLSALYPLERAALSSAMVGGAPRLTKHEAVRQMTNGAASISTTTPPLHVA